jgi:hypothetical protein
MLRQMILPAILSASLLAGSLAAQAQYYDPYRSPPSYEDDDDDRPPPRYDRPGPRWGYERRERERYRSSVSNTCETSRGSCDVRSSPIGSSCRCYIDGFGPKRGIVVDD